jgi:hypothetical protein
VVRKDRARRRGVSEIAIAVALALAHAALGPDALQVIDGTVRHAAPPPPGSPALSRELLAQPLEALDADAIFRRAVPGALARFAGDMAASAAAQPFDEVLERYLGELEAARDGLLAATSAAAFEARLLERLPQGLPSSGQLAAVAAAVDPAALDRANQRFLVATARFVRELRAPGMQFPPPRRFASRIGTVVIGGPGDERHAADAALIVDPGGNDLYERRPVSGGALSVIVDFGGDDRYTGSDVVVRGLSALVDLGGDDRYDMSGPGLGAAIAGVALLVDAGGDDRYAAGMFGQGAAAFGIGALIDLHGDDSYLLHAGGQGYGLAAGLGLLWDREGNDRYRVAGFEDPFRREAGLSFAQGAASGYRDEGGAGPEVGGGIGILRDERGDDAYEAEMFAQGLGYFHGVGVLWDGGGNDRYRAVRYAQGNGVHQAVGVLRDESGDDRYELSFGAGQGMGLDLAVGVLLDLAGNDSYEAGLLAQGSATANGIGLLADRGGDDLWRMTRGTDLRSWGHAEWYCGLPSVGLFLPQGRTRLERAGVPATRRESPLIVHEQLDSQTACGPRTAALERFGASASFLAR